MNKALLWIWQLPQHLLGRILIVFTLARPTLVDSTVYISYAKWFRRMGICLGDIIIIGQDSWHSFTIGHEKMHQRQSHLLGPLYLFTVGIVSITRNIYGSLTNKSISWYYGSWPENWHVGVKSKDD